MLSLDCACHLPRERASSLIQRGGSTSYSSGPRPTTRRSSSLLTAHTFRTDPPHIHVIVSDAAGSDGFGYFFGPISANTPEFRVFCWDTTYFFVNSHSGELTALLHFVERTDARSCLLLCVSDSQSAVYGVNNGTCWPEEGLAVLARILTLCDSHGIVLIAFCVPRESNRISDYLSHVSHILRSDVAGCFDKDASSALAPAASGSWDPTATHALARSTGVHPRRVEEVVGNQGGRRRSSASKATVVRAFRTACLHAGTIPFPPSGDSISLFLVQLVMRNSGSCRSIGAYKMALQQECTLLGVAWLSPGDQLRLASLIKALEKEDFNPLHRKLPLQEPNLQRVAATSDRSNPHHLLTLLLLYVDHDGLLRAGEIVSGLMTADVIWSPDRSAMALRFTLSKTCLTGPGFMVQFRDRSTINAVSREWWEMMGLRTARTVTLFPKRLSETRFDWSSPISYDSLVTRIKLVAHRLGLSTDDSLCGQRH